MVEYEVPVCVTVAAGTGRRAVVQLHGVAGYDAAELEGVVHVECKAALLELVRAERLGRQLLGRRYVYLSADPSARRQ